MEAIRTQLGKTYVPEGLCDHVCSGARAGHAPNGRGPEKSFLLAAVTVRPAPGAAVADGGPRPWMARKAGEVSWKMRFECETGIQDLQHEAIEAFLNDVKAVCGEGAAVKKLEQGSIIVHIVSAIEGYQRARAERAGLVCGGYRCISVEPDEYIIVPAKACVEWKQATRAAASAGTARPVPACRSGRAPYRTRTTARF